MKPQNDPIGNFFVGLFWSVWAGLLGGYAICLSSMNTYGALVKGRFDFRGSLGSTAMLFTSAALGFVLGMVTAGTFFYWRSGTRVPGVGIIPAGCGLLAISISLSFASGPYGREGFLAFLPATIWCVVLIVVRATIGCYRPGDVVEPESELVGDDAEDEAGF